MPTATRPAAYDQALALFRANRFAEAQALLEQCVQESPEHIGSRFGLGVCLARMGQTERSIRLLRDVIVAAPDHYPARLELIRLLRASARLTEAVVECQTLLRLDPSNAAARYELAACELDLRKSAEGSSAEHVAPAAATTEAEPEPVSKRLPSLAAVLDGSDELPSPTELGGQQEFRGRRPIYTFARLPIAVVLILVAPAAADSIRSLTPSSDEYYVLLPWELIPLETFLDDGVDLVVLTFIAVGALLVISAMLSSMLTRYVIRERRLEVTQGVWRRSRRIVWYFDVTEVRFQQTPFLAIFGTGRLMIRSEKGASIEAGLQGSARSSARSKEAVLYIVGASSAKGLRLLQDRMYRSAWYERRAMKKTFI
jgi:membrane protein YdbS with pleckstrin-like domain